MHFLYIISLNNTTYTVFTTTTTTTMFDYCIVLVVVVVVVVVVVRIQRSTVGQVSAADHDAIDDNHGNSDNDLIVEASPDVNATTCMILTMTGD